MTLTRAIKRTILAVSVMVAALLPACDRVEHVNVVLISIDTLRDDHCSFSGYARPTTPQLELLAAQGARLVEAIRVAQQLTFCIFTFNKIEAGSGCAFPDHFDLAQLNSFIERYACRVPTPYRSLLAREHVQPQPAPE